jgi:hypothetical protein
MPINDYAPSGPDSTPSRAFPRILACPICPPRRGSTLRAFAIQVTGGFGTCGPFSTHEPIPENPPVTGFHDMTRIEIEHVCERCDHYVDLLYGLNEDNQWEFSLRLHPCPPQCTTVHGLFGTGGRD